MMKSTLKKPLTETDREGMLSPADVLDEIRSHPAHLVRRAYQIFTSIFDEEMSEFDITPVQFIILVVVFANPGIDVTRLAGLAAIDKTSCGRGVDKLARCGLVRVSTTRRDRRQKSLVLTDQGRTLLPTVMPGVRRVRDRLLSNMSRAEQRKFMDALSTFVALNNEASRAPFRDPSSVDELDAPET